MRKKKGTLVSKQTAEGKAIATRLEEGADPLFLFFLKVRLRVEPRLGLILSLTF